MPGVVGLLGVIALNYFRYRFDRGPTICATVRRHVPRPIFAAGFSAGFAYLFVHVWRGYPPRIFEESP